VTADAPTLSQGCNFFNWVEVFEAMKRAVDSNTIVIIASCPEYAFGNFDPVEKIAALAQSWGIGCHSDCCLGSYINPFAE
jgi:glutamate/tyrosine decarboxylase-like PLP-dependent enzyme